jgi:hypothetical protein
MAGTRSTMVTGAVAGVIAATSVAIFFLVADVLEGRPLYTPGFLAAAFAGTTAPPGAALLAAYTFFHYLVFIVIGIGAAWVIETTRTPASYLLGAVLGMLFFDLLFYGAALTTGGDVVQVLGWPAVLASSVAGGLVLMAWLRQAGLGPQVSLRQTLRQHTTVQAGVVAGVLGATIVAVVFLVIDVARGQVLFTPAALGSALFAGARGIADVQITATTVLGYTLVHYLAFGVVGVAVAAMLDAAQRLPHVLVGVMLLFVSSAALFIGLTAIVAVWVVDALGFWTILVANLLAAAGMAAWYLRAFPRLRASASWELEEEAAVIG